MGTEKMANFGLLILRIGIGVMFIYHGLPKLMGGPGAWEGLGKTMGIFGITFLPQFWGFMAAFAEAVGGVALIAGIAFRPFLVLLLIDMIVASTMHLSKGQGLFAASHAVEMGIVFLSLIFTGPGKYVVFRF